MESLAVLPAENNEPVAETDDIFTLTETGLQVNRDFTYAEWQAFGWRIYAGYSAYKWALADWLIMGENRFGENFAAAKALTGYKEQTLLNYATTARSIEPQDRNPLVSFTNPAEIASLSPENRKFAMDKMVSGEWDRGKLRTWKRSLKTGDTGKPKPQPRALTITPELVQTVDGRWRYALPENLPLWIFEKPLTIYVTADAKAA